MIIMHAYNIPMYTVKSYCYISYRALHHFTML